MPDQRFYYFASVLAHVVANVADMRLIVVLFSRWTYDFLRVKPQHNPDILVQ